MSNLGLLLNYDYFDGCKFKTVYIQGATKGAQYIPCTEKYIVNEDNPDYSTLDGVLYDKAKKILLRFPPLCQATSVCATEIIGPYAFSNCDSLRSISIDPPTKEIGDCAFYECYKLQAIKIPSSVTQVFYNAFFKCYGLLDIYFEGVVPPVNKRFWIANKRCVLHVPKGSKDSYQKLWPNHTIVEE